MGKYVKLVSLGIVLSLTLSLNFVSAQAPERGKVALLLDLSGSMNAELNGTTRRDVAVEALSKTVENLDGKTPMGLYAFGNNYDNSLASKEKSCEEINQIVDFGDENSDEINTALDTLEAKGWTPLAKAINVIGNDLSEFGDTEHHLIILSDGEESCNGDPVAEVERLKELGINVVINTIGLDVDSNTKAQLEAIASAGGGNYFNAADAGQLDSSLAEALEDSQEEFIESEADFSTGDEFVVGGNSFEDAVELDFEVFDPEKTYSLPANMKEGSFMTYTFPKEFEAGDKLIIGLIFADKIDLAESGEVTVKTGSYYIDLQIYNKRKARVWNKHRNGFVNNIRENELIFTEEILDEGTLFIGSENYDLSKDVKIYFEFEKEDGRSYEQFLNGDAASTTLDDQTDDKTEEENISDASDDENKSISQQIKDNFIILVMGVGIMILLIVLILILLIKGKRK